MKKLILQSSIALTLSACTDKYVYDNIQINGKLACQKEPPSLYEECKAQYDESYESYKNSRDKLLKDSAEAPNKQF